MPFSSKCLRFEGTDEYVTMGNVLGFERTDSFSISFWVKHSGASWVIVNKMQTGGSWTGYEVYSSSAGQIYFTLISALTSNQLEVQTTGLSLNDGQWHHIIATYAGTSAPSGIVLYADGSSVSFSTLTNNLTASIVHTSPFRLGTDGSTWTVGRMDEVAVYNRVLSAAEVTWIYNSGRPRDLQGSGAPSNLLAWWRMGEWDVPAQLTLLDSSPSAVHPTVRDLSGNNYTGTATNMEVLDVLGDVPGDTTVYTTKSVRFEGTDEYVTMGDVLDFDRTNPFSVSLWVKIPPSATTAYVVSKIQTPGPKGWDVYVSAASVGFELANANPGPHITVYVLKSLFDGEWHHIVATWNGDVTPGAGGAKIYVDGVMGPMGVASDTLASNSISNTGSFMLGQLLSTGFYLGFMDEVSVYSKELLQADVSWIYNSGVPRSLSAGGAPSNLVGWWRMGEGDTFPTLLDSSLGYRTLVRAEDRSTGAHHGTYAFVGLGDLTSDTPGGISRFSLTGNGTKYVSIGDYLNYTTASPFSLSAWVKYTHTNWDSLIGKRGSGYYTGYLLCTAGGPLGMILRDSGGTYIQAVTSSSFNNGNWHHVVGTWDGSGSISGIKLYVDGALQGMVTTGTTVGEISNSYSLSLASSPAGAFSLVGSIDEAAIYGKTLSLAEVQAIYNSGAPTDLRSLSSASDLAGWWPLGESSAPGTMTNQEANDIVQDYPHPRTTFARNSVQFDGVNEYVDCGNVLGFERTDACSFSFWFKTAMTSARAILTKMDNSGIGWAIEMDTGYISFHMNGGGTWPTNVLYVHAGLSGLNDGAWHHCVITKDTTYRPSGIRTYIDGIERTVVTDYDTLSSTVLNSVSTCIAKRVQSGLERYFPGNLDEISVYNRVLTQAEASWIYNSGTPRDLKNLNAPSGLVGWWRMGEGAYQGALTNMEAADFLSDSPDLGGEGQQLVTPVVEISVPGGGEGSDSTSIVDEEVVVVLGYKMRAQDSGATPPGYVTWSVTGSPDFAGAGYSGGTPTPIGSMVPGSATVVATYEVN